MGYGKSELLSGSFLSAQKPEQLRRDSADGANFQRPYVWRDLGYPYKNSLFSQCSVSKVLWRSPLRRRPLLPPTRPLLTRFLRPLLRPPLLHKPHSWINSACSHLQLSSAFQHGEMLPEQPAVGGRSCCSPRASTGTAPVPARSASEHMGAGGANCKCGLSVRASLRNLVIWKLWVCLLVGLCCGMDLENVHSCFYRFSVDCLYGKGI